MPVYSVIGYYEDNSQRFCDVVEAKSPTEAEDDVIRAAAERDESDLVVVGVVEGEIQMADEHTYARSIHDVDPNYFDDQADGPSGQEHPGGRRIPSPRRSRST